MTCPYVLRALALTWGHVRDRTILVERAVSLGQVKHTKTRAHRTVRLRAPLQEDLQAWRLSCGPLVDSTLVFPGPKGELWTKSHAAGLTTLETADIVVPGDRYEVTWRTAVD